MLIFPVFIILLSLAFLAMIIKNRRFFNFLNCAGHFFIIILAAIIGLGVLKSWSPYDLFGFFYIDALSAFFILTVSLVNFAAALYSLSYIAKDVSCGNISPRKSGFYYFLFNLFACTMFFVISVNNLGMVWVAIEMTTLVSAFLVGFYNNKHSVEAAWKYLIICSVGITLALFGTILFYYAVSLEGGIKSLNWTEMAAVAKKLDPAAVKVAFLFILIGYGTKAGLVPMHTWLPDAHSQALAPISALLSGVLLKTAVYAILRFTIIANKSVGMDYTGKLFVFFALVSLGVSAGFILVQKNLKRLLAYSSIEHIGVIFLGFGLGGSWGVLGGLFHLFNHAVTKPLLFLGAGSVVKKYNTNNMNMIQGIIGTLPFTGFMLILGVFALAGMPPFSIFFSELMILASGFLKGAYFEVTLAFIFLAVSFSGLIMHFSKIVFGKRPDNIPAENEPVNEKCAFIFLLLFICSAAFLIPGFSKLLIAASGILRG